MFVWKIRYDAQIDSDPTWSPMNSLHVGGEDGETVIQFVKHITIGSDTADFTSSTLRHGKVTAFRLRGIECIGRVTSLDGDAMVAEGIATRDEPKE